MTDAIQRQPLSEEEALNRIKRRFRELIPTGPTISRRATEIVLGNRADDKGWIKDHFSELVDRIQIEAYETYLRAERPSSVTAMKEVLGGELPEGATAEDLFALIESYFFALDRFFLGLTQGRRPRAGKAFEHVVKVLFDKLGYPYTPQPIINGQPDFLLPNVNHWETNAMDCIIFTVKRTLRERWRQVTTEGTRGHQFFLATIDPNIANRDLPDMLNHRIYLVMPENLRAEHYAAHNNVISFEKFFDQHLDPAMARWRANDVIPPLQDDPSLA